MSDGKVIGIHGGVSHRSGEPCETSIEALKDLLERAEAGEVQGVAVAYLDKDGVASFVISGRIGGYPTIGAIEAVKSLLVENELNA